VLHDESNPTTSRQFELLMRDEIMDDRIDITFDRCFVLDDSATRVAQMITPMRRRVCALACQ